MADDPGTLSAAGLFPASSDRRARSVVNSDGRQRSTPFARRVLTIVRRIPAGRVATYGDIAALAGRPRAARAVGNVMRGCTEPGVPCHRVVGAGGQLGGYGDRNLKRGLLAAEGIRATGSRLHRFAAVRWQGPML